MSTSRLTCMKFLCVIVLIMTGNFCFGQQDIAQNTVAMIDPPAMEYQASDFHSAPGNANPEVSGQMTYSMTQGNVFIQDSLNIGLQSGAAGYRLSVDGKIMCEELKVQSSATWPDYVFDDAYPLLSLDALEAHIAQHGHLPNIPSADKVAEEGIVVGEMQRLMMEKIEELTLYIIAQEKRIQALEAQIAVNTNHN